jgi:hypothetical protein
MRSKRIVLVGVLALLALGLSRAARFRFHDKEAAVREACQAQLRKLGITRDAAKAKYPTPEIHMVTSACLMPGGTGEVVIKGKFPPETKFIFQNDNIEVVKEALTPAEYRATLKAAPGIGPETASVRAITAATCITAQADRAAVVGGKYEWTMDAANGWRVVARSASARPCGGNSGGGDAYEALFFRKGETTPFEKRSANLSFDVYDSTNYRFTVSQESADSRAVQQNAQQLMMKMSDPNLTNAQREQIMAQLQKMQQEMMANMAKMTDPNYIKKLEEARQQFGCESIHLQAQGDAVKGELRCAQAVGTRIALTGVRKLIP